MTPHTQGLLAGYGAAAVLFWLVQIGWRRAPPPWSPADLGPPPARRWRTLAVGVAAAAAAVGIGASCFGWLVTLERGAWRPLWMVVNQGLVFAPVLLVIALDPRRLRGAMLVRDRLGTRLVTGITLAGIAVLVYSFARPGAAAGHDILLAAWHPRCWPHGAQVLLEDLTIGMLLVRFGDTIGRCGAVTLVAILFAAGHVPAMLQGGMGATEVLGLVRDTALGAAMGAAIARSRDIAWFFPLHFTMDMTQFVGAAR